MLHVKFGFDWPSGFRGEDLRKWWTTDDGRTTDGRTDDGRTTEHGYTISSPCEPDGSGELKTRCKKNCIHSAFLTLTIPD